MTDIAELAFRVQTAELDKAAQKLDGVKTAAVGLSSSAKQVSTAVEASARSIAAANTAMANAEYKAAQSAMSALKARGNVTAEERKAAQQSIINAKAKLDETKKIEANTVALMKNAAALKASTTAQRIAFGTGSSTSIGSFRPAGPSLAVNNAPTIPRDQMPNRFNTANIAAQFQDIGVTAAMGMNPLTIALQQGTQLAAIMNSMVNPAKGLAEALKSVFNATSLLTIGIVGVVAALLQFVNWTAVAKGALYGLASAIQFLAPYVIGIVALLALFYSEAIIAGIASITTSIIAMGGAALVAGGKMALAWMMALTPLQLIILGIGAVALAFQAFGINAFGYIKNAVNAIVGAFIGAFNAVKATWKMLPAAMGDIVVSTANIVLKKIADLINGFIGMINGMIDSLPDWAKPEGGKITWKAELQLNNPFEGEAAAAGKEAGEAFKKAMDVDYVGNANKAVQEIADSIAGKIRNFANGVGQDKAGKDKKDPWEELVKGAERKIQTLKAEAEAVGMSAEAAARLKYETELLNEAQQKNIKLTPQQKEKIEELAQGMATAEVNAKRVKEAYDFGKDASRGFFQDMKQGLIEGKNLWETFGNAVVNVLNKIFDKLLNSGVDKLFDSLFKDNGGGGFLSSIFGGIGDFLFNAKGNVFGNTGIMAFAKGGAFTNSVVNRATPFTFANGGAFGMMGEKGPEAVMPLHRGPDGSLGVRVANDNGSNGGGTIVAVNINNYGNSKVSTEQRQTSRGLEIDVMIDQATAQNVSRQGSETNRALNTYNNRQLISR